MTEAQKKREAWLKVEKLAEEALQLLVQVNEGHVEQAQLMHLVAKAPVQAKLWRTE